MSDYERMLMSQMMSVLMKVRNALDGNRGEDAIQPNEYALTHYADEISRVINAMFQQQQDRAMEEQA